MFKLFMSLLVVLIALVGCEASVFSRGESKSAKLGGDQSGDSTENPEGADDDGAKGNGKGQDKNGGPTDEEKAEETKKGEDVCSKKFGGQYIKVHGNQTVETVSATDSVVAKVSGNQDQLHIDVIETDIAGICLFVMGNLSKVTVNITKSVGEVYYRGLGNQSNTEITVGEGGSIGSMSVRVGGNQAVLKVSGSGDISCDGAADVGGNGASYVCP